MKLKMVPRCQTNCRGPVQILASHLCLVAFGLGSSNLQCCGLRHPVTSASLRRPLQQPAPYAEPNALLALRTLGAGHAALLWSAERFYDVMETRVTRLLESVILPLAIPNSILWILYSREYFSCCLIFIHQKAC